MKDHISEALRQALDGAETSSQFFEVSRHKYSGSFADIYPKILAELYLDFREDDETAYAFLIKVFEYRDLGVAKREAKMIESETGNK